MISDHVTVSVVIAASRSFHIDRDTTTAHPIDSSNHHINSLTVMALSKRAQRWVQDAGDLPMFKIIQDLYDKDSNPNGYISLGVAENTLMHDIMVDYINKHVRVTSVDLTYGDGGIGSKRLRRAMAAHLTRKLSPVVPIEAEHITMTNGVTAALEHISSLIADPGDAILVGRPYYYSFTEDLQARPGSMMIGVRFGGVDPLGLKAVLQYEACIRQCRARGQRVAGILLCNPHNPLGRCYSRETLIEYMKLCQRHGIHLISDEIYALSVFRDGVPFTSLASIPTQGLIDPARTTILYGLSKDFGANGLRVGALVSQHNRDIHTALVPLGVYSYVSSLSDRVAVSILEDEEFVDAYVTEANKRLNENYQIIVRWADRHNIKYARSVNAAFFLWCDLGEAYRRKHKDAETRRSSNAGPLAGNLAVNETDSTAYGRFTDLDSSTNEALLKQKIYLASGTKAGAEQSGLFRIVFSHDREYLEEGLRRIEQALDLT